MKEKLSLLFDYQRFKKNADLQAVIDAVHARYPSRTLSEDEAETVAAAGMPETALKRSDPLKDKKNDVT